MLKNPAILYAAFEMYTDLDLAKMKFEKKNGYIPQQLSTFSLEENHPLHPVSASIPQEFWSALI